MRAGMSVMGASLARGLSTAAKGAANKHAPPIKLHGIAGRYAEATFTAASKANLLDKVATELGGFKEVMRKSPNFAAFLSNPSSEFPSPAPNYSFHLCLTNAPPPHTHTPYHLHLKQQPLAERR